MPYTHKQYPRSLFQLVRRVSYDSAQINDQGSLYGRKAQPTAMILDSRMLQSTPESGARAGYNGAKRRKGSKVHAAVDTLGHLLALHVTPANEQDRA
jgi:hypothetical protein